MPTYYDGARLLSMKDIDGNVPEIYLCTTNKTGGKTTYFSRLVVNRFLDGKGKFAIIYRFSYELKDCADKFFKDVGGLFFPKYYMRAESRGNGAYYEMFLVDRADTTTKNGGKSCGYAIALNNVDQIKRQSHQLSDVNRMVFDEFQSETNHYCSDEVGKLIAVHTAIARGQGKQTRYVPVYMLGNPVTLLNPYYVEFDISKRLQSDTRFLRGEGFVLEQGFVASAAEAMAQSGFNRAFKRNRQIAYQQQAVYLNDNQAFVEKMGGKSQYIATLKYYGKCYGIRVFAEQGIIYCDSRPDVTFPFRLSVTTEDHNINYVMLRTNQEFINKMRYYFDRGCFRFKDLQCKDAILKALSY